jgi:hypothetical protein
MRLASIFRWVAVGAAVLASAWSYVEPSGTALSDVRVTASGPESEIRRFTVRSTLVPVAVEPSCECVRIVGDSVGLTVVGVVELDRVPGWVEPGIVIRAGGEARYVSLRTVGMENDQ